MTTTVPEDGVDEGPANNLRYGHVDMTRPTQFVNCSDLEALLRTNADLVTEARRWSNVFEEAHDKAVDLERKLGAISSAATSAAHKFDHYEQLHRLKCTAEGDEKADRNREMADMLRQALKDIST